MFVMDCYGHKLSNGVLFAHHLILDVPGGSSHLGYRRRVPPGHYPTTRVKPQAAAVLVRKLEVNERPPLDGEALKPLATRSDWLLRLQHRL